MSYVFAHHNIIRTTNSIIKQTTNKYHIPLFFYKHNSSHRKQFIIYLPHNLFYIHSLSISRSTCLHLVSSKKKIQFSFYSFRIRNDIFIRRHSPVFFHTWIERHVLTKETSSPSHPVAIVTYEYSSIHKINAFLS